MTTPSQISSLFVTNTVVGKGQQIWNGGSGVQPFIFNNDEVNTLYVGPANDVLTQSQSSTIPVPPLGGQVWPDVDIWAFAPTAVNVLIVPGATAWAPSPVQVQVALNAAGLATKAEQITQNTAIPDNISTTGAPLLNLYNSLADAAGTVITTGNQVTIGPLAISQIGYEFVASLATLQNAVAAPITIDLRWTDSTSGLVTAEQNYGMYSAYTGAGGNPHLIEGHGPSNADTLTVTIFNASTVSVTVSYALLQSSRAYQRHAWRTQTPAGNISFPTMTYISCVPAANLLAGQTSPSLNSSSQTYLLPFYVGTAQIWGSIAVAANAGSFLLIDTIRALSNTVVGRWKTSSGDVTPTSIILPRDQCQLQMINGTATASTMSAGIIVQELESS
jgi:hypothetical protein